MAEEMKAVVAEYLGDNKKSLELLRKGAGIEHGRYPADFTQGYNMLVPYFKDIRTGVRMLELESLMHVENFERQLAIDSVAAMFGVARSLEKEPLLISQLVRISCQTLGVSIIERIMNRAEFADKQLMEMDQILVNTEGQ